ncbi:MAG TPA: portal protein, partial [Maribacter sp.]|nr:portal protein [Maribacter sp.]
MAENNGIKLFGFELRRLGKEKEEKNLKSIVPKVDDDGAGYVTAAGSHYGQYLNMDGDDSKDNTQLVMKYRGVAMHPEVDQAIEDIVNEAITGSEMESAVDLVLDKIENLSDSIKKQLREEFDKVVSMLNFNELGHDIFRRWY